MSLELKEKLGLNLEVVNAEMMYKAMRVYSITEGDSCVDSIYERDTRVTPSRTKCSY